MTPFCESSVLSSEFPCDHIAAKNNKQCQFISEVYKETHHFLLYKFIDVCLYTIYIYIYIYICLCVCVCLCACFCLFVYLFVCILYTLKTTCFGHDVWPLLGFEKFF